MARTLSDWLDRIANHHPQEIDLSLDRVRTVFERLLPTGIQCPVITVAGTNGKGSTVAYIDALARASGIKALAFTSPHLYSYRERLTYDNQWLTEQQHIESFRAIEQAAADIALTFFEISTLSALYWADKLDPDLLILEVGLGGRLDSTNIVDADVAVITTIDFDHQEYLGNSLAAIAREKLGVVKKQTTAVLADNTIPVACITDMRCKALIQSGIDYQFVDGTVTFSEQYKLPAQIQPQSNAAAGLVAFHQLFADRLSTSVVDSANQNLQLKGRYQVLCQSPLTILDVAHNPQAINHLVTQLQQRHVQNIHAIIGMMHDKNLSEVIRILKNSVMHWHFCDLDSPRAATARQLRTVAGAQGISLSDISCYSSPTEAYGAVSHHVHPSEDSIIITGSFLTVGPIIEQANL